MILEEETFKKFGYHSRDLKSKSHKKILAKCNDCGKIRELFRCGYRDLCSSCSERGKLNPNFGKHRTSETKRKISEKAKKRLENPENRPMLGKHHTEEAKQKNAEWHRGRKTSEETKQKLSNALKGLMVGEKNPMYGKHPSEETKLKIKLSNLGRKHTKEARQKMSDAQKGEKNHNFGKHPSEETRNKISKANKNPSKERREKMSIMFKSEGNPNWKGGISKRKFEEAFGISEEEWYELSIKIRMRDNYTCQYCGKEDSCIVHHINPRRIGIDNNPDNLIILCNRCHPKVERLTDKYLKNNKNPIEIFYERWSK